MTATELNELIIAKLGIKPWELNNEPFGVRFDYRGSRYFVDINLMVEKVDGACLVTDSDARQLEKLLRGEQWDGTGLPPVGMKLEWKSEKHGWLGGTVAAHDAKYPGIAIIRHNDGYTGCHSFELRTAEMCIRGAAIDQMIKVFSSNAAQGTTHALVAIYDAIVAGKIDGLGKVG